MSTESIETLFERFRTRGDLAALTQLFDEVAPELLPLALRLSGERHDAEDLVQETFLVALEKQADYDAARPLRPWLVGILVHQARRLRRKSARVLEPERVSTPLLHEPLDAAAESELRSAVESALGELPPKYSTVVSLHLFEGLAPRELSARLGIDAELVRTQLARGLEKLRRSLPASGATAWSVSELGLVIAAMRTRVLTHARSVPIQAGAASTSVLAIAIGLAASLCAVAALTAGALSLVHARAPGSPELESVAVEASSIPDEAAAGASVLELDATAARESAAEAQAQAHPGSARLHGRLLMPDGSGARGVTVTLEGRPSNEELVHKFGAPKDWKNPPDVQTDSKGEFQFTLEPPRAFQWFVRARSKGFVDLGWRLGEWIGDKDLGSETFEPACVLTGTLSRADGAPIGPGWTISADPGQDGKPIEALDVYGSARVDPASGTFRVDGMPAGSTHVEAWHEVGLHGCESEVRLAPTAPVAIELTWAGADPAHTVCVYLSDAWHTGIEQQDLHAELVGGDGRKLLPVGPPPLTQTLFFEDVPESQWRLEVKTRSFRPVNQESVKPGQLVTIRLEGNASIQLHVADPEGKALEHYDARLTLKSGSYKPAKQLATVEELSADGRSFDALPSRLPFELEISAAGLGSVRIAGDALTPGEARAVRVTLPRTREIVVRALDADGKTPLPGVEVELTRGDIAGHALPGVTRLYARKQIPPRDHAAKTGADGRARFSDLTEDRWTARANWGSWLYSDTTIDLHDSKAGECTLTLPEHGFLRGKVLLAEHARLDEAILLVQSEKADRPGNTFGLPFAAGIVAPDGSFRLGPLAPGRLVFFLMRCSEEEAGEFRKPVEIARVEIEAGKDTSADIDLRHQCTAHLELKFLLDGKPMRNPDATVLLVDMPDKGASDSARGTSDGTLRIALAPERRQRISLRESGWVWCLPEVFEPGECETLQRTIDIKLAKGSLLVLDEQTHEPLRNASVAWSVDVRELSVDPARRGAIVMSKSASGTTDPEGRLELTLPPCDLRLIVGDASRLSLPFPPKLGPSGEPVEPGVRLRWTDKGPAESTIALPRR